MDTKRKNLNIYFKEIEPWTIIERHYNAAKHSVSNKGSIFLDNIGSGEYRTIGDNELWIRSQDEMDNSYEYNKDWMKDNDISPNSDGKSMSIFNMLSKFGEVVLSERNGDPIVEYEHLLRWKESSHNMGQDVFTCAFFASKDLRTSSQRHYFSWKPIIETNNNRLENILSKGMAENHFHLKGSSNTCLLSWISLMNRVQNRRKEFKEADMIDGPLKRSLSQRIDREKTDLHKLVVKASFIRVLFFKLLNGELDKEEPQLSEKQRFFDILENVLYKDDIEMNLEYIQRQINSLKIEYGYKGNFKNVIDYAIPKNIPEVTKKHNIFMVGERRFLYDVFRRLYSKDEEFERYGDLFYAYLVIQEKFRSELIQVNKKSGFMNFSNYQDRKCTFLDNEKDLKDGIYSIAVNSTLENQSIKSLESRVVPWDTFHDMEQQIREIDDIVGKGIDRDVESVFDSLNSKDKDDKKEDVHFYNFHFIKYKDKNTSKLRNNPSSEVKLIQSVYERDFERRRSLKSKSHAFIKLRNLNTYAAGRIYGIDACANEIGCRPEVFAHAFRFMRTYASKNEFDRLKAKKNIPVLGATYHAGEDFIDIIDGLRAIDEVVKFIKFGYGDRIGHALALGIDVREWADCKERTIVINKQDYLDNVVWLMCKMRKFNVNDRNLEYWLEKEFYRTFDEIYMQGVNHAKGMESELRGINTTEYYWSWKLRGDNPELYKSGEYKDIVKLSYWDSCSKNSNKRKDGETFRKNKKVSYLYHLYHYNSTVKSNGTKMKEYKISEDMINAVTRVQKGMMNYVKDKGIAIETNPSSNVLIGTFKKYNKHPLINFYNLDLTMDQDELRECPQMFVSINTDDQGVFDTYLENEYALMALALEKEKNTDGTSKYNQAMIYRWIDNIRQMGLEQSFRKPR